MELVEKVKELVTEVQRNDEFLDEALRMERELERTVEAAVMELPKMDVDFSFEFSAGNVYIVLKHAHGSSGWYASFTIHSRKRIVPDEFKGFVSKDYKLESLLRLNHFVNELPILIEKISEEIRRQREMRSELAKILERVKETLLPIILAQSLGRP